MVVHYGPSHNVDEYVQECGRGGRDGEQSQCVLYWYPGCTRRSVSNDMKFMSRIQVFVEDIYCRAFSRKLHVPRNSAHVL